MDCSDEHTGAKKRLLTWLGTICLLAVLPIKLVRFLGHFQGSFAIGIAPSVLVPAGFLFYLLSSTGRMSRLSLPQATLLTATLFMALEFMQLLPRPGILSHIHYTFDYYDLGATLFGVGTAYVIASRILRPPGSTNEGERHPC